MGEHQIVVRPATLADVEHMHALINGFAKQGLMLAKSRSQLYQNIRDFCVAEAVGAERASARLPAAARCTCSGATWARSARWPWPSVSKERRGAAALPRRCCEDADAAQAAPRLCPDLPASPFLSAWAFAEVDKADDAAQGVGRVYGLPQVPEL